MGALLALCKQAMPDGILLDWNMPIIDGFEFLSELRSMPGVASTWASMSAAPASRRSKPSIPMASAIGKPTADQSE